PRSFAALARGCTVPGSVFRAVLSMACVICGLSCALARIGSRRRERAAIIDRKIDRKVREFLVCMGCLRMIQTAGKIFCLWLAGKGPASFVDGVGRLSGRTQLAAKNKTT